MNAETSNRPVVPTLFKILLSLCVCAIWSSSAWLRAQDDALPNDPIFQARMLDGQRFEGRLAEIAKSGQFRLVTPDPKAETKTLPLANVWKLSRRADAESADMLAVYPPASGSVIFFADGDRLVASLESATDTQLVVGSFLLGDLTLPLSNVKSLILSPPENDKTFLDLSQQLREQPEGADLLWMSNGDRQKGGILKLDPKVQKISFRNDVNDILLDFAGIRALGFDPALVKSPAPASPTDVRWELALSDGSRLTVSELLLQNGMLTAKSSVGPISVKITDVCHVSALGNAIVPLSDKSPDAAQYGEYVGPVRPFQRNRNVQGTPLQLLGQRFDRGIGAQSKTLLAYRLTPEDRTFQADIGVDDSSGPLGNVVFRVLVDGKPRFESPPMSARDEPVFVNVDLQGGKVLILVTDFGQRGDVRDHGNWIDPRILRSPK